MTSYLIVDILLKWSLVLSVDLLYWNILEKVDRHIEKKKKKKKKHGKAEQM